MLQLKQIVKEYPTGDTRVEALKGIDIEFRQNEFVSILGPSGCGKTTLLNIIGGLDKYTSGDLIIKGKSTKEYKDRDWDNYRNHTIGFVFQSYNLIPHQSVISNVEMALTLTGVPRKERRERAIEALKKVGLGDQLNKKPNQMSGGQMQRVAIARALVNNPEVLLADEPTGALDTETSVQIMDLLKEIAKEKLVIMVTHNPDLATTYSTRIIKLLDGKIIDDSAPFKSEITDYHEKKEKRPSMSLFTALSLSLNNLMTKKARTFLTSFAGSIGIIGIALILSLSSGVNAYISKVEEDTLSSYPIQIQETSTDVSSLVSSLMGNGSGEDHDLDKIYSNNVMNNMMTSMINGTTSNNLTAFKDYIDSDKSDIKNLSNDIQYNYKTKLNVYKSDGTRVNPSNIFEKVGVNTNGSTNSVTGTSMSAMPQSNTDVWKQLVGDDKLINKQYEVLAGRLPEEYNEVVIVANDKNEISDYTLYSLGIKDPEKLDEIMESALKGEKIESDEQTSYSYDDLLALKFKLLVNSDYFEKDANGMWVDKSKDEIYVTSKLQDSTDIKVVGVLRSSSESGVDSSSDFIGYRSELMTHLIDSVNASEIVKDQKNNPDTDIFTGLPFKTDENQTITMDTVNAYIASLPAEQQAQYTGFITQMRASGMTDDQIAAKFQESMNSQKTDATYDSNLLLLGVSDVKTPSSINIYPKDFESKNKINDIIDDYNEDASEADNISYTDYIGLMLSSVTTIINAISYILIAFVSISLVVSSIMIGIITYISVLERTKEIGILRAIGASKRDVSRVFNAETLIVGFVAGAIGILLTLLLLIPANIIIENLTDIAGLAQLPIQGGIILVLISMILTFIAGLIPSRIAAKKDPVTSLRSE